MGIKNKDIKIIPPNVLVIDRSECDYSPIDVVQEHLSQLDQQINIYFVINTKMMIMHKVIIRPNCIEAECVYMFI